MPNFDLNTVKNIAIPEGNVKKIEINGVTIWNAPLISITLVNPTTSIDRSSTFTFGGTVIATYGDGSTADVTANTIFSGYNMSISGTYTVTAAYEENNIVQTATYSLTVNRIWSTVWSGDIYANLQHATSGETYISWDVWTNVSLTGSNTLRFTFTMSSFSNEYWYENGSMTTTKPASPLSLTLNLNSDQTYIVGALEATSSNTTKIVEVRLEYSSFYHKFYIQGYNNTDTAGPGYAIFEITKIERYY